MRTDTPFDQASPGAPLDIDQMFADAAVPDLGVDPTEVLVTGRRVRRRRRLATGAGLVAATAALAIGAVTVPGLLDGSPVDPAGPSTSSSPTASGGDAPEVGSSVRLRDVTMAVGNKPVEYTTRLDYRLARNGDGTPTPVLKVTTLRPRSLGDAGTVVFDHPRGQDGSVVSRINAHVALVVAPRGVDVMSIRDTSGSDLGGVASDRVDLPGSDSVAHVFVSERPTAEGTTLRGLLRRGTEVGLVSSEHEARYVSLPTVAPDPQHPGDVAFYSRNEGITGLFTSEGGSWSSTEDVRRGSLPGSATWNEVDGRSGHLRLWTVLPEGARSATASYRDESGERVEVTLALTALSSEQAQIGYGRDERVGSPTGDVTVTWVDADGTSHEQRLG